MGLSRNSSFSMACCVSAVLLTRRFIRASKVEKKCLCTNFLAVFLFRCSILCCRRRRFFDMQPCGAENGHRFLTCNPAAQKKSIIFGLATLRRRKNPLFLDVQPCSAEKTRFFLTCNPEAQKILRKFVPTKLFGKGSV